MVNLFFIGVPAAGTTSLGFYLDQHSDILVSKPKETCFHILEWGKGIDFYKKKYFNSYDGQRVVCDASILNLYFSHLTAPRIHKDFPNAKLLVILRDPIERAYSDYCSAVNRGLETLSFEKAFYAEERRKKLDKWPLHPRIYFTRGLYYNQLKQFSRYFPKESFKIVRYEDFSADPGNVLAGIFEFLGVSDESANTDFTRKLHVNRKTVRNIYLQRLLRGDHRLGHVIKAILPAKSLEVVREKKAAIMERNLKVATKAPIDPEFGKQLARFYRQSNSKLKEEYGVNTDRWCNSELD